jgi:hypothetical protein
MYHNSLLKKLNTPNIIKKLPSFKKYLISQRNDMEQVLIKT